MESKILLQDLSFDHSDKFVKEYLAHARYTLSVEPQNHLYCGDEHQFISFVLTGTVANMVFTVSLDDAEFIAKSIINMVEILKSNK